MMYQKTFYECNTSLLLQAFTKCEFLQLQTQYFVIDHTDLDLKAMPSSFIFASFESTFIVIILH